MNYAAQIAARGRFSRLASSITLAFVFAFALDHPLHAQLVVSFFGSPGWRIYQ